jgi:hypothetical protein
MGGSLAFGVSAVAEQRGTKRVPHRAALAPVLLLDLARQRLWLAGLAANLAGTARRTGPGPWTPMSCASSVSCPA